MPKPPDTNRTNSLNLQNSYVSEALLQELHVEQEQATDAGISSKSIAFCHLGSPLAQLTPLAYAEQFQELPSKHTHNTSQNNNVRCASFPVKSQGDYVSGDQLQSTTPGFVALPKGRILTKKQDHVATVLTNQNSDLSYRYLGTPDTVFTTLAATSASETYAQLHNIACKHFRCNTGSVTKNHYTVNQHISRGRGEKRFRHLPDAARTTLLHIKVPWPLVINTHLCPYTLKLTNQGQPPDGQPPLLIHYSNSNGQTKLEFYIFGCQGCLSSYIGQSPSQSHPVALMHNPVTGIVSSTFHIPRDNTFHTLKQQGVAPTIVQGFGVEKAVLLTNLKSTNVNSSVPTSSQTAEDKYGDRLDLTNTLVMADQQHKLGVWFEQDANHKIRKPTQCKDRTNIAFIMGMTDDQMDEFQAQRAISDHITFKDKSGSDTLYYHKAMQADNREQFIDTIPQEIHSLKNNKQWELMKCEDEPKQHITGMYHDEAYSPVVSWTSIRVATLLSQSNNYHTIIDFVLDSPQEDVSCEAYMGITQGFIITNSVRDLKHIITKSCPTLSSKIFLQDEEGEPFIQLWECQSHIGKPKFLGTSTCPQIAYMVHQCIRLMSDPKDSHAQAIKHIGRHVLATVGKCIILSTRNQFLEFYAGDDFSGNWNQASAILNPSTAGSRSECKITLTGCSIICMSKLQMGINLSTAESNLIYSSQALRECFPLMEFFNEIKPLREVIPLMEFFKEIKEQGITHQYQTPTVYCKLFEDNSAALEIARVPKMRPRTKHINIKYHHFRQHVKSGQIKILPIDTKDQIADIFTKPLPFHLFNKSRELLLKWSEDDRVQVHRDELRS